MSRSVAIVAFLGIAGLAAGVAWWALRADDPAPAGGSAARTGTAQTQSPDAPGGASKGRAATKRAGADPAADALAVAGVVVGADGRPVADADVECYPLPENAPEDGVRVIREALRGVVDDDAEIRGIVQQLGGDAGASAPEPAQMQRMMRAGQRIAGRLASDPSAMRRALEAGRGFSSGLEMDADLGSAMRTRTDADGAFRVDGLAKGRVELRVRAAHHQRRKLRADVGRTDLRVELAPAGTVAGRVRCGGEPVAGAVVRFRSGSVTTGADGRFVWDAARPPREPVVATADGCVSRGLWVAVEAGRTSDEIVLDLDAAGRIEGRVTTRDGLPVAGAVVGLAPDMGGMMQMFMPGLGADAVPVAMPTARTRQDGTYAMDGVPARTMRLRADAEGFLGATAREVRVPPREVARDVDFTMVRESVLTGRVTDVSGRAVAGAEVRVDVPGEGAGRMIAQFSGGLFRSGTSDADGRYRVGSLPEGSRGVTVDAEGMRRTKSTVTLPAEGSATMDFVLEPGLTVAGRVVAPDGAPVAGATVRVSARGGDRPAMPMLAALADTRSGVTDADGRFTVTGLQDGPYDVTAASPRWLDGTANGVEAGADVTITLGAAAVLRGVVVRTADGAPVAGATVLRSGRTSRGAGGNPFAAMMQRDPSVETGPDGAFEMAGVAPGAWELWARSKGYADSVRVKVEAVAGGVQDGVSLALPPGSSAGGRVVRKSDGSAIEGAVVWVRTDTGMFRTTDAQEILGGVPTPPADAPSAKTGADGVFLLEGLTPGKVTLEVRAAGFAPRTVAATEVPSTSNVLEMTAGGAIEGTVFDKTGMPTEGATVILQQGMMGAGYVRTVSSGRDGRYRIERIPPGSYSALLLDPESPMGMGGMSSVSIRDGETTTKDFGRRAAGSPVEGTVTAGGVAADGATVMLLGGPAGFVISQTDAQGRFRFDHVEAGEYSVMVQTVGTVGGGTPAGRVTVTADGTVQNLALQVETLTLDGTVTDAETGRPVPFAQAVLLDPAARGASLQDMMARQKGQAFTDAAGRFRISGAPRGTFSLRVTASGYAETEVDGVSPGGAPVKVSLARGLELAVTVLGPDGKPVSGAAVVPEDAGGREGLAMDITLSKSTGPDGVARLRLQPGRYVLHVRSTGFPQADLATDAAAGTATVRLEAGGGLDVIVRAAGAPVAGATVKLLDAAGAPIDEAVTMSNFLGQGGTTDANGRARREGLRAGRVTIVVRTPAGREVRSAADVAAGRTVTVEVAAD